MAHVTRDTLIVNPGHMARVRRPARKAKKRNMAMTLKQKLHFGTKRQRAAAKAAIRAKRSNPRHKRRTAAAKHRTRTAAPARRPNRPKARKTVHRNRTRKVANRRPVRRQSNPGQIIPLVFGNPSRRRKKTMAKARRNKSAVVRRRSAGSRKHHVVKHHRTRHNPGRIFSGEILKDGVGVVVGVGAATFLPQLVMGASNTGLVGYFANLAAAGLVAWAATMTSATRGFAKGIALGGVAKVIARVISDYSLLGSYSASVGLGDHTAVGMGNYIPTNTPVPISLPNVQSAMVRVPPGWGAPAVVAAAPAVGKGMGWYSHDSDAMN